jgi:Glu-tRNA(Gln) amidotransferase subunit E-like FAD-binding protein
MTDYQEIGLKSGIEIHQQLATHKLFCPCPSEVRQTKPDFTVKRELRPLAGELGEIDPAAIFERKKRKYYIYEAYDDTTCLVELDEEPPHPVNPEALDIALLIAKMLHCKFPDVVQVMRKTVINGSNTSGFQRTALIGYDGFIETSFGKVGIQSVALEEDAARRTAENPESVTFRLDRLGIPLVEIATAPDCKTPEQVKELAEKLGALLRSTGKVIRGIGTIRQDVNISTKGHPRIELKGVQELPHMPKIVELEAERQQDTIKKGEKIVPHVRNILPDLSSKFLRPMPGAARMYPETDLPLIFLDSNYISNMKLPESTESVKNKLQKLGLSADLVDQLATSEKLPEFEKFAKKYHKLNSNLVATTMLVTPKEVKRKLQLQEFELHEDIMDKIISALDEGAIVKESVSAIMEELAKSKQKDADSIISKYKLMSDAELKKEIAKLQKEFKGPPEKLIGVAIGKFRGKANPQKIIELLKK